MRVFVTGASGWIGSAVVPELIGAGHDVIGLARSDASAAAIAAAGAEVHRGSLDDLDSLRAGAEQSDGVIHLAFIHDFSRFADSARVDLEAIRTIGNTLEGTHRPFLIASGVPRLPDRVGTELDAFLPGFPRSAAADVTVRLADRGVRSVVVRFPPTVHGDGDHGFIATLVDVARERAVSGYIGDGRNRWSAVHRDDAATFVRLALERAPAGSVVHAVGEEGVPTRTIAEVIGRKLGVPVQSVAPDDAAEHFGWIGMFFAHNAAASSDITEKLLDWHPTHAGLVADLEEGHYFAK